MASWWGNFLAALRPAGAEARARHAVPLQTPTPATIAARRLGRLLDTRGLAGGRLSMDAGAPSLAGALALLGPDDHESNWRILDLDNDTLENMAPDELVRMLADLSPDISRALWDFERLFNPGWSYTVTAPGKTDEDVAGKQAVEGMLARLKELYGSVDVALNRLSIGAFLRGAFCAELVLDKNGREFVDLATPDPGGIRFKAVKDPIRGTIWQAGQWQAGKFVIFDRPTFRYLPIDPFPGNPYGRPLASPALFTAIFLIGLMHDLRRVVSQQGYPRLDLSVSLEKLAAAMPADMELAPDKLQAWVNQIITEVQTVYAALEPDDAYIHTDVVAVNRPVGAVDAQSLGAVDGLIKSLERMAIRALKTMPLLMGVNEATSETHANRQWEVHVAGIKALQHLAEALLEYLFGLALQAQGIAATVTWRFAELRAAEMMRDAQTENMRIGNARAKYDAGWTSQDEAAQEVCGHDADMDAPRVASDGGAGGLASVNAEPGSQRQRIGTDKRIRGRQQGSPPHEHDEHVHQGTDSQGTGSRVKIIPEGADEPLPPVPDEVEITDADIRRAINAWDEAMPDYAGLLEAVVIGQENYDEQDRAQRPDAGRRSYGDDSPWTWDQESKRYRNSSTGQYMGAKQMLPLRDDFIAAQKEASDELAAQVAEGEITNVQYVTKMRELIKTSFIDEYAIAHGGRHNMTSEDFGRIGYMCREQYGYLNDFAAAINAGELSPAQIRARGRLYIEASSQAYERAAAEVRGIHGPHALPAYPGDGTSNCKTNCHCTWEFVELDEVWECTWTLHPAEHCTTCVTRAREWAPYVVAKPAAE